MMKAYKIIFCCVFLFSAACGQLFCAAGGNVAEFLKITPDPKIAAMGEGGFADASSYPAAAFNNPAGIAGINRPWFSLNYIPYPADITYHFASFAVPSSYGNFGTSFGYLTYGGIEGYYSDFSRANIDSSYDLLFLMTYCIPLKSLVPVYREHGAVGLNVKFVQSALGNYVSESLALDAGGIYNIPFVDGLSAGLSYRNLGSGMKFAKASFPIPSSFNLGLAYKIEKIKNLQTVFDYTMPSGEEAYYSLGASISPVYFLTLRAGYKQTKDSLLSDVRTGIGFEFGDFTLDYAYTTFENFSPVHRLSLSMVVGSIIRPEAASDYFLDIHFREASAYYYRKDYVRARQLFEEILSVYPEHRPSQKYLERIMQDIDQMEELKIKRVNYYLKKAEDASDRKDFIASRKYFNYVLTLSPDEEQARVGLERNWQVLDDIKQEKTRRKNIRIIKKLWDAGLKEYTEGEFVLSKDKFAQILEIDPSNEGAKGYIVEIDNQLSKVAASKVNELYSKATEFYKQGNYKDAMRYFEAVTVASPHRMDAQDFVKKCKENLAEIIAKEKAGKVAKEQDAVRSDMTSNYDRALRYYEKGSYKLAFDYFSKCEELAVKYHFDKYIENIRNYLIIIRTTLAEYHYKKGFEYFRNNKPEEAAQEYKRALQYSPENTSAKVELGRISKDLAQKYYEEGMTFYSKGDMFKARELFNKSLSYDPDKIESKRALGRVR